MPTSIEKYLKAKGIALNTVFRDIFRIEGEQEDKEKLSAFLNNAVKHAIAEDRIYSVGDPNLLRWLFSRTRMCLRTVLAWEVPNLNSLLQRERSSKSSNTSLWIYYFRDDFALDAWFAGGAVWWDRVQQGLFEKIKPTDSIVENDGWYYLNYSRG